MHSMRQALKKRRAFTLTELAIVLGVIGGLAGAIWAVASDVNISNQVRVTNTQLVGIAHNIRTLFVEQGAVRGATASLTPALDRLKVFPLDMRQVQNIDTGVIFHIWSNAVDPNTGLGSVQVSASDCTGTLATNNTTAEPCFSVMMLALPQKSCVQMLDVSTIASVGLQVVVVNGVSTAVPTDTNSATTACSLTTNTNTVQWVYLLRDK